MFLFLYTTIVFTSRYYSSFLFDKIFCVVLFQIHHYFYIIVVVHDHKLAMIWRPFTKLVWYDVKIHPCNFYFNSHKNSSLKVCACHILNFLNVFNLRKHLFVQTVYIYVVSFGVCQWVYYIQVMFKYFVSSRLFFFLFST